MANAKELQEQLDAANADLQIANDKVSALEAENAELKAANQALAAAVPKSVEKDVKIKPILPATTFEVDGKKYRFIIAYFKVCNYNDNQPVTAEEALADKNLLAQLVQEGSGVIEEVA